MDIEWASKGVKARVKRNVRRLEQIKLMQKKLEEDESSYVVERKAFVFKSNTQENDQESIVYGDDKKPDSEE